MSFTDKKTLSVAEAVKSVLSKHVDPNDPNDPRNFRSNDPEMLKKYNDYMKNIEAEKKARDTADSFGKSSYEEPKEILKIPEYKRISHREISGPVTKPKKVNEASDRLMGQAANPSVMATNRLLSLQMAASRKLGSMLKKDTTNTQTQSGTVSKTQPVGTRNAANVLRAAQNPSQDQPSTEKQRLGMKYYEKKPYPGSSSSVPKPEPKLAANPNQDKVDAANRVQSAQRAAVLPSPSAKDSEDSQSAKKDVISSAMRKQQDTARHRDMADNDTDKPTPNDNSSAPDDDINKAVKQAKEPAQKLDQDVKEIDVTDKNKSKKNEEKQMTTFRDAAIKALYETKKKADKDYDKDGKIESPKDEVWGSRLRAAKMAGKLKEEEELNELKKTTVSSYAKKATSDAVQKTRDADYEDEYGDPGEAEKLEKKVKNRVTGVNRAINRLAKEEVELDEAFPTVADGEKSLKAKEGKTTHGKITKTKTGMKHERDYDDQPEPEVKRGRGRPKKRLSEMRQEYFNYIEEEVDNETFKKELEDQKAKFDGKKKGADVAKPAVQAVKQEEVEQIDEVAPPGREDQVKALKKVPGIDNPWAVSWASYRKSHPKKSKD